MPYVTNDQVKQIREALKKKYPKVKFSIVKEHHSSVRCAIMESSFDFGTGHMSLNHYPNYLKEHHKGKPYLDFLVGVAEILSNDVRTVSHDGDYGDIPNYYVTMQVGKWDKPHVTKP